MKHIIFCEGKYDKIFLTKYFEIHYDKNKNIDTFSLNNIGQGSHKKQESTCIKRFLEKRNPYDILVKVEGNKSNILGSFPSFVRMIVRKDIDATLFFDLDDPKLEAIETINKDIEERIVKRLGSSQIKMEKNEVSKEEMLAHSEMKLKKESTLGGFNILGVKSTMDDLAHLPNKEDAEEVEEAMKNLARDSKLAEELKKYL